MPTTSSAFIAPSTSFGTYGGYPIHAVADEVENCIELGFDPGPLTRNANRFSIEIGERPGFGCILMIQSDVDNLILGSTYSLVIGTDGVTNQGVKQYIELKNVVFQRSTRVYPGDTDDDNSLVYVYLTDIRYYLQKSFIDKFYNIHPVDQGPDWSQDPSVSISSSWSSSSSYFPRLPTGYYPTTLSSSSVSSSSSSQTGSVWTWSQILTDIWAQITSSLAGSVPSIPCSLLSEMAETPDRIRYNGISAFSAYCQALKRLGLSIAFDPYYGGMSSFASSASSGSSSSSCRWLERPFYMVLPNNDEPNSWLDTTPLYDITLHTDETLDSDYVFIPDQIKVCFNAEYSNSQTEQYHLRKYYTATYTFAQYLTDRSLNPADYTTLSGTVEILWGDLDARFPAYPADAFPPNAVLNPTNKATLDWRAKELGRRFYDLRTTDGSTLTTYSGCLPIRLSGIIHKIEWYDQGDGWKTDVIFNKLNDQFFSSPEDIKVRDVVPGSGSSGSSGSGGGGGTTGCNCFNCIQSSQAPISTCSYASSAAYQYLLTLGIWPSPYVVLGGNQYVTYSSSCMWLGSSISVSSSSSSGSSSSTSVGVYQWRYDMAGPNSQIYLTLIAGVDVLGII